MSWSLSRNLHEHRAVYEVTMESDPKAQESVIKKQYDSFKS